MHVTVHLLYNEDIPTIWFGLGLGLGLAHLRKHVTKLTNFKRKPMCMARTMQVAEHLAVIAEAIVVQVRQLNIRQVTGIWKGGHHVSWVLALASA